MKKKPNSNFLPKKRVSPKPKYHWYFWDYIYYRGERARIKNGRYIMNGFIILFVAFMQILVFVIFLVGKFTHLSEQQLASCSIITLLLFTVWYYMRYQKDRVKAMIIHYENNKWNKKIPDILFLFIILALCAINLYILNDNTNM